ncbi:MAG: universal stress protein [Methanobacterium sp.]|nr:universal stress protein [Methanobacterium sp.]MDY9923151.1 universal stress protein [Methanobacterium sp.]
MIKIYKKILLPTDGSEYANKAAEHAIIIACQNNAEIIVLNVIETTQLTSLPVEDFTRKVKDMLRQERKNPLEIITKVFDNHLKDKEFNDKVKLTLKQKGGSPEDIILQTVEEEGIDMVIMGTSGKKGLERFLLGSVTEKVVRNSKCPVLTVHLN